jgi:hypothetical protein
MLTLACSFMHWRIMNSAMRSKEVRSKCFSHDLGASELHVWQTLGPSRLILSPE